MKRWLCVLLAITAVMLLASCGSGEEELPTEPEPQLHTVVPASDLSEVEWAHIDGKMTLEDGEKVYAKGSDFLCFALVVADEQAQIRFKLDKTTAEMLKQQNPGKTLFVTLNESRIGDVVLNEDCDELTLVSRYTYEELCRLADRIRGFVD